MLFFRRSATYFPSRNCFCSLLGLCPTCSWLFVQPELPLRSNKQWMNSWRHPHLHYLHWYIHVQSQTHQPYPRRSLVHPSTAERLCYFSLFHSFISLRPFCCPHHCSYYSWCIEFPCNIIDDYQHRALICWKPNLAHCLANVIMFCIVISLKPIDELFSKVYLHNISDTFD